MLTGFDYDIWGQLAMYGEGTTDGGATFIYQVDMTNDSASRTVTTFTSGTASRADPPGGKTLYNPNNSLTASQCLGNRSGGDGSRLAPVTRVVTDKENTGTGERQFDSTWPDLREEWIGGLFCTCHFAAIRRTAVP